MKNNSLIWALSLFLLVGICGCQESNNDITSSNISILSMREQANIENQWLDWRMKNLLGSLMEKHNIDMWVILCREYNEDPLYFSFVRRPTINSYRTTAMLFERDGDTVKQIRASRYSRDARQKDGQTQAQALADYIKTRDPQRIGINVSDTWHLADGLTATLRSQLESALGQKYSARLVSAEGLCLDWLAIRTPGELHAYKELCKIAHALIAEFYSSDVITPGLTTIDDMRWYVRQRINEMGIETWFQPIFDIQRGPDAQAKYADNPNVIQPGDLLHCDVGIIYMGLCTDMQSHAYVCMPGQNDAPASLKQALQRTISLNEIIRAEFADGRTGQEIGLAAIEKSKQMGLDANIYCHSLGTHGHAAGTRIDTRPTAGVADENPARRKYPVLLNTVYAIEYCCYENIPEWDGMKVEFSFEDDAAFTANGCDLIDGHHENFYLIK